MIDPNFKFREEDNVFIYNLVHRKFADIKNDYIHYKYGGKTDGPMLFYEWFNTKIEKYSKAAEFMRLELLKQKLTKIHIRTIK